MSLPKSAKALRRKFGLYKKADFKSVKNALRNIPTSFLSDTDVYLFWSTWFNVFMATMSKFIRSKRSPSTRKLPHITKSIIKLMQKKVRLYRRAKCLNTLQSWSKYNKCRNNLTSALQSAKKDFFSNLARNIHSPKDFWSAYHKLPPNHPRTPPQITLKYHSAEKPLRRRIFLTIFWHLVL